LHRVLLPTRKAQQNAALQYNTHQARSPFWLLKTASEHAHAHLLPRLSWSWTVLLPSDKHRKPITSITAALLPFVTYLLTVPRTSNSSTIANAHSRIHYSTHWVFEVSCVFTILVTASSGWCSSSSGFLNCPHASATSF
jgi:hypothetical protein